MKPYIRKVQYYETDMMGVTHHANYIHWMEEARIDFIPFDRKAFKPHITLMRKPSIPVNATISEIKIPAATMLVEDVCLYRSDRGKNGMVYTIIGSSKERSVEGEDEL